MARQEQNLADRVEELRMYFAAWLREQLRLLEANEGHENAGAPATGPASDINAELFGN